MGVRDRFRRFKDAADDRTGYRTVLRYVSDHEVHGGARFAYALGSALLFTFLVQIVTGIALATVYSPSVTDAWGSVYYIEHKMLLGSFVRGVHHFGASAMIVLAVLHMTQVLMFGAHRKPREVNWILGVLMLLLIAGFGLTGYLLPWDQKGYWATKVATGIMGEPPGGVLIQTLVQGGADYGNATLTRFYTLHVLVFPLTLGALVVGHLALFYRHGVKRSPREKRPRPSVTFWPYQVLRDLILAAVVFGCLAALALLVGVGLEAPADPASAYEARPEWYFLFLFQLLKYFEGPLSVIGTMVLPGLALAFLFAVPFIEKKTADPARSGPSARVLVPYAGMLAGAALLTVLALNGDAADSSFQTARAEADATARRAVTLAEAGGIDAAGRVVLFEGLKLYQEKGCASCHDPTRRSATDPVAPRLVGYGTQARLERFLRDPDAAEFFGGTPLDGAMSAVDDLGEELAPLVAYLMALDGETASVAATIERGRVVFGRECVDCHNAPEIQPGEDGYDLSKEGPDLAGYLGFEWTRGLIRGAGHPQYFGGAIDAEDQDAAMPPNEDLGDAELSLLTRWLIAGSPGAE